MEAVIAVDRGDGMKFMVGKVFLRQGKKVFLHENPNGSGWLVKYDSPGAVDAVVIDWLLGSGVEEIHHWNRAEGIVYVASVIDYRDRGIRFTSRSHKGGHSLDRFCLPKAQLTTISPYRPPWVAGEVVLDARPPKPIPSSAGEQPKLPGF